MELQHSPEAPGGGASRTELTQLENKPKKT